MKRRLLFDEAYIPLVEKCVALAVTQDDIRQSQLAAQLTTDPFVADVYYNRALDELQQYKLNYFNIFTTLPIN